jgi:hypothetical protein
VRFIRLHRHWLEPFISLINEGKGGRKGWLSA